VKRDNDQPAFCFQNIRGVINEAFYNFQLAIYSDPKGLESSRSWMDLVAGLFTDCF
jgi:hypothetical protein